MPNLPFLHTDEQRFDTLACMGNDRIHMPKLNRLAERTWQSRVGDTDGL